MRILTGSCVKPCVGVENLSRVGVAKTELGLGGGGRDGSGVMGQTDKR